MATHFYYNGHTYEIEQAALNWTAADANATALTWDDKGSMGVTVAAHLAIIESAGENAAILSNIRSAVPAGTTSAPDGGGADYLWLGASDVAAEGTWLWSDATPVLAPSYTNWGSGLLGTEPDNFLGDQDYMAFAKSVWPTGGGIGVAGQWNDLTGTNLLWSIIEWDGLIGTAGNDKLTGTAGNDVIDGGAGKDTIKAGGGDDTIYAGDGDDNVDAGEGDNTVVAETTSTHSDDGNDKIKCGSGADFIASGTGDDTINAGDGDNLVVGADGNDKITTGAGDDVINVDGIYAEDGVGGAGNDTIKAGAGDDYIVGGKGADLIWGGLGLDSFVFDNLAVDGVDTIRDFEAGATLHSVVDTIVLDSAAFTTLAAGPLAAESFIKGRGLTGASPNETGVDDYLIFDTGSGKLYYDADGNLADETPVLIAVIKGKITDLNFEDFLVI